MVVTKEICLYSGHMSLDSSVLTLPLVSLPTVVLPGSTITLNLSDSALRQIIEAARRESNGKVAITSEAELASNDAPVIGVVASVPNIGNLPNGEPAAIIQIDARARIGRRSFVDDNIGTVVADMVIDPEPTRSIQAAARQLRATLELIAGLRRSRRLPEILASSHAPGALADAVASWADFSSDDLRRILRAVDVGERGRTIISLNFRSPNRFATTSRRGSIRASVNTCCGNNWRRSARNWAKAMTMWSATSARGSSNSMRRFRSPMRLPRSSIVSSG